MRSLKAAKPARPAVGQASYGSNPRARAGCMFWGKVRPASFRSPHANYSVQVSHGALYVVNASPARGANYINVQSQVGIYIGMLYLPAKFAFICCMLLIIH